MAAGITVAAANTLLDSLGAAYPWIKLHVGNPGAAGTANAAVEATRKQASWASASAGSKASNAALNWTSVSTTENYTYFSAWSAATGGTCGFTGVITNGNMTAGGNFTINSGGVNFSLLTAS